MISFELIFLFLVLGFLLCTIILYFGGEMDFLFRKKENIDVNEEVDKVNIEDDIYIHDVIFNTENIAFYQEKLDKFWQSQTSNFARGNMYERFIKFKLESVGCRVEHVPKRGGSDKGIDLICRDGKDTYIVQCKNQKSKVSPKEVRALSGTVTRYSKANTSYKVKGVLFTSSSFSDNTRTEADELGIELIENECLPERFPIIKCKIDNGFYYLPMDIQYDDIEMDLNNGDKYYELVEEAEEAGFRYAYAERYEQKGDD